VSVSGSVSASGCAPTLTSVRYVVHDEYGQLRFHGSTPIASDGMFSFKVPLVASRRGDDRDGRHYRITIRARTAGGAVGTARTIVTVPHSR
jgi:hypothetical protein